MVVEYIKGGVCAPIGFQAAGVHCGIRKNRLKKDLALILSNTMCSAAAVFTLNKVKGAPILVSGQNLLDGKAQAIICNSGNANTCAPNGEEIAVETCKLVANYLGLKKEDIIVASTGVIGEELKIEPFLDGVPKLVSKLSYEGSDKAAHAIMTTDTTKKEIAISFNIGQAKCSIGGIAKGSGMINPNMATMLSFITTDVAISPEMLKKALSEDVKDSFNQVSVDGDTSTNDTVAIMANGMAGNKEIISEDDDFYLFCKALRKITTTLAREIAKDGEGATKVIECNVTGAPNKEVARNVSKGIISSDLFKAAMFGADANWGRALCAIGYTEGDFNVDNIDVTLSSSKGSILVCKGSTHNEFSEEKATKILKEKEIGVLVQMNQGDESATAWGCDLTYDYVKINGDYRS